jgi:hypothetical protein
MRLQETVRKLERKLEAEKVMMRRVREDARSAEAARSQLDDELYVVCVKYLKERIVLKKVIYFYYY